ncbi:Rhodanese-like domain-containing protein [Polychytrium aggregatum]|uniref:Rhodanese-like domain-containing protein n=1 Tax=Polychytrium aggregatum TaxID=110093 RepID=UPI0022FE7C1C|nr:Rhodanese-like domain-containing protein [Polychytrium aggregatum]KAI9203481.1 Rhodanese-like domain-containing protein [Polychytrium aggregatum]
MALLNLLTAPRLARRCFRPLMASSPSRSLSSLVSTQWLQDNLGSVVVLDGSWHMPALKRNAFEEYLAQHVPGARFFDIDRIADQATNLPHMLPSTKQFEEQVGQLGISNDDHIVVYDFNGVVSACRVYWTFKVFGHQKVSVLDGGIPKWINEQRPVESGTVDGFSKTNFQAVFHPQLVRDYSQITQISATKAEQIVDARSLGRFQGSDPEPRVGLSSGHMPNSVCVPFNELYDPASKTLLPADKLRELYRTKGVNLSLPIVNSCGSGITAAVNYVAQEQAGAEQISVYDGSWTEYASKPTSIIEDCGPR